MAAPSRLFFSARHSSLKTHGTAVGFLLLCQTGIIRTGSCAADFRLNRVIRLANTMGY